MSAPECLDLITLIPFLGVDRFADLNGRTNEEIFEALRHDVPAGSLDLLEEELLGPDGLRTLLPTACFLAAQARGEGRRLVVTSEPPSSVMEFARTRRVEVVQRIEGDEIRMIIRHVPRRHPRLIKAEVGVSSN